MRTGSAVGIHMRIYTRLTVVITLPKTSNKTAFIRNNSSDSKKIKKYVLKLFAVEATEQYQLLRLRQ